MGKLSNHLEEYLFFAFLAMVILGLIGGMVWVFISSRRENKKQWEKLDDYVEEPNLDEVSAQVLSKNCGIKVYGTKTPDCCKEFSVTFLTTYGKEERYAVLEEVYLSLEEGAKRYFGNAEREFLRFLRGRRIICEKKKGHRTRCPFFYVMISLICYHPQQALSRLLPVPRGTEFHSE